MITVINKRSKLTKAKKNTVKIYVGRPTVLGNPYREEQYGRNKAIALYGQWLQERMLRDSGVSNALALLKEVLLSGKDLELECWCAPKSCHADVIKDALDEWFVAVN